ncbi:hypothetical protein MRX96_041429 [Rhipicephalus microplus]
MACICLCVTPFSPCSVPSLLGSCAIPRDLALLMCDTSISWSHDLVLPLQDTLLFWSHDLALLLRDTLFSAGSITWLCFCMMPSSAWFHDLALLLCDIHSPLLVA